MARAAIKQFFIGPPLATSQLIHQRITKLKGLAVFSSDALSSTAYATEEILIVLVTAGAAALPLAMPIAIAISAVLAIVAFSYYQTIHAYPTGGGAYIVAHDNLGMWPGLVAAAALLIDYVLTVSVSVAAGVAAITSAVPGLFAVRVALSLAAIVVIAVINLRGVRESATIFAIPTYAFIFSVGGLIALGLARTWGQTPVPPHIEPGGALAPLALFLILRAYSSGSAAMTGVEAISNGIPAFRQPESRNAGVTLIWMATILISLFLGLTFLAHQLGITPREHETVVSQIARQIFGGGAAYFTVQFTTAFILILAANTSFADFPRLSSILARDGFLPRQLANLGDRLVFANGIAVLALLSGFLVFLFHASTHALIPLYAVGVFLSFTLSQAGMVKRWWTRRGPGWTRNLLINGIGSVVTAIVLAVVVITKFARGAWIVMLLVPLNVWIMYRIHQHYEEVRAQLSLVGATPPDPVRRHKVVVPIAGLHRGVLAALQYARSVSDDVVAVVVDIDPRRTEDIREKWERWGMGIPLVVLESPYRSVIDPLLQYLDDLEWEIGFDQRITVVLPEFVPTRWWHFFLHGQAALLLKLALYFRRRHGHRASVVTDVPYYLETPEQGAGPGVRPVTSIPLLAAAALSLLVGAAFVLALINGWPAIVEEVLGVLLVLLLAGFAFSAIIRSIVGR
ncbi:MAG TPA: APC family permease [bacterium]